MATGDLEGNREQAGEPTSQPLAIRTTDSKPETTTTTSQDGSAPFDIVETYKNLLLSDPDISMPVAAIEALIALLGSTPATTAMETVSVVRSQAERLRRAVPNPIPLTAGTDLFQQYLLRSLKGQTTGGPAGTAAPPPSFDATRQHLLRNSRLFAARAKAARDAIADRGSGYVLDGSVVLAAGSSRTVAALLLRAADRHTARWGSPRFRVVHVLDDGKNDDHGTTTNRGGVAAVSALRARGVPTATIGPEAAAHVLSAARVDMVFVGTEVVVQNGGLLSRMGTFQLATLCRAAGTPFYVAAETHKIVRLYPLSQADLPRCGVQQDILDFRTDDDGERVEAGGKGEAGGRTELPGQVPVDYTPPGLISAIITEQGVKNPAAVYDMLLDIYT